MRIAIVSDIHGNRHAFEAVLDAIEQSDCEEMWCLGDLVGYGAEPDACVELARRHAAICLAGNHDLGVMRRRFRWSSSPAAPRWRRSGPRRRSPPRRASTSSALEPANADEEVGLYHASPRDPVWEYVLSPLQAELCLDAQTHRVCLIGHSHVALSFCRLPGPVRDGTDARTRTRSSTSRKASG